MRKSSQSKRTARKQFPVWAWGLLALLVIAAALVAALQLRSQPASAPRAALPLEISVSQAAEKRDQGAFILDVRQPEEWDQFHIPGATLIPLGELPNRLGEVPKEREIVVVCRSGNRSAQGRDILLNAGFKQVTSMAGGVTEWQSQGLPITSGN